MMNIASERSCARGSAVAVVRGVLAAGVAALGLVLGGCQAGGFDLGDGPAAGGSRPAAERGAVPRGVLTGIAGEPEMRVRIVEGASTLSVNSGVRAVWVSATGDPRPAASMTAPVRVALDNAEWVVTDAAGLTARFARSGALELAGEEGVIGPNVGEGRAAGGVAGRALPQIGLIRPGTPAITESAMLIVNNKAYPGFLRLMARSDKSAAAFDVIEHVAMEDYLRGVVAAEMFTNWPLAAYQAQAVAARSYALHERSRARAAGERFDVEASVRDQAYAGAAGASPVVSQAVESTRGVVLTWAAQPVRAYYSSTCGGRPAAARDTWPTGPGFDYNLAGPVQGQMREHACQGATYYRWTTVRGRAELAQRLRAFGQIHGTSLRALTGLDSIRPAGAGLSGRPNRFLVMQPGGQTYTVTGEELRRAANTDTGSLPKISASTRVHSSDMDVTAVGDQITFVGRGFGHGVGLCQWCAKGFAAKGEAWSALVQRFYPGARLERVY